MKFLVLAAVAVRFGLGSADEVPDTACPTVTKELLNPSCSKNCSTADCMFVTTVQNPCGCPATLPTASLLLPCEADCPYDGCAIAFRATQLPCSTTTSPSSTSSSTTRTRRPRPPTSTSTSTTLSTSTSSTPLVITSVTTIRPRPPPTPCPTVTMHTRPGGCDPIPCPVPTCISRETVSLPCGCEEPKTVLYVEGCSTACPEGCMMRTTTVRETACPTRMS